MLKGLDEARALADRFKEGISALDGYEGVALDSSDNRAYKYVYSWRSLWVEYSFDVGDSFLTIQPDTDPLTGLIAAGPFIPMKLLMCKSENYSRYSGSWSEEELMDWFFAHAGQVAAWANDSRPWDVKEAECIEWANAHSPAWGAE